MQITQSDLNEFFPCPRNWILKSILKLKDYSLETELIDKFEQGTINHETMKLLFDEFKNRYQKIPVCKDGSFGDLQKEIQNLVTECVKKAIHSKNITCGSSPLSLEVLVSQQKLFEQIILSFLYVFCAEKSDKSFGGCSIVATEKWLSAKNPFKDYGIAGQLDCILSDDEENIIIIDYKNGDIPTIKECQKNEDLGILKNFQCAEYISLFNNQNKKSIKVSEMAFYSIKKGSCSVVVNENLTNGSHASQTMDEYEKTLELFNEYTDEFYKKIENEKLKPITNKNETVFNYVNVFNNCKKCNFRSICRSCFTVAGKKL